MTLTPSVVPWLENQPEEWAKTYALEYLKARHREVPAEMAHAEAVEAANIALHGFQLDPKKAKELDRQQWMREAVERIWACYMLELEGHVREPVYHELTTIRQNVIRKSLAQWRASKQRTGRSPEDCLKDQVRGCFYVARQRQAEGGKPPRLDPEGVLAVTKSTKAAALAWWAHKAFEEE